MYVLVFWTESRTKSVVHETDLHQNVEEGEKTLVSYKDNKKYEARVVKKSRKFIQLICTIRIS